MRPATGVLPGWPPTRLQPVLAWLPLFVVGLAMAAEPGWAIRRVADMPDGAPAFDVFSPKGAFSARIECLQNGWVDPDALAVRLMRSTEVMAAIQLKAGRLEVEDLGPAKFDCMMAARGLDVRVKASP
jgi:hypothetical protein